MTGCGFKMFRKIDAKEVIFQECYREHKDLIDEFESFVEISSGKNSNKSGSYAKYLVRLIIISSEIFDVEYTKNDSKSIALYVEKLRRDPRYDNYNVVESRFPNATINEFLKFVNNYEY